MHATPPEGGQRTSLESWVLLYIIKLRRRIDRPSTLHFRAGDESQRRREAGINSVDEDSRLTHDLSSTHSTKSGKQDGRGLR